MDSSLKEFGRPFMGQCIGVEADGFAIFLLAGCLPAFPIGSQSRRFNFAGAKDRGNGLFTHTNMILAPKKMAMKGA